MGYEEYIPGMTLPGSSGDERDRLGKSADALAMMVDLSIAMRWKRRSLR
jgi:hypothetical protein